MKRPAKSIFRSLCLWLGICLLAGGIFTFAYRQISISAWETKSAEYTALLRAAIPEPQGAILEERLDNSMAVLPLGGQDFIGILELPAFGSALPVGAGWGDSDKFPCRLSGSIYDGSLQIGATSQKGQFDFYREISVGDSLFFTDVSGNRYTLTVKDIRYFRHADQEALSRTEDSLTLFIKNINAFEYIIIYCEA